MQQMLQRGFMTYQEDATPTFWGQRQNMMIKSILGYSHKKKFFYARNRRVYITNK